MSSKVKDKQVRGNNVGRTFQMQEKAHVKGPEAERRLPYLENSNKGWCSWNLVVIQERTECGGAGETGKCQKKKNFIGYVKVQTKPIQKLQAYIW